MKPVKGWEGLYNVTEDGQISSVPRNGTRRGGRTLSHSTDSYGYSVVKFRNKNKVLTKKVHRIVAEAFLPNPENKPQVNHEDGDKKNNHISNLRWVTASENIRHAKDNGLQCECPNRVSVQQYTLDGEYVAEYESLKAAGEATHTSWTGISAVIRGKRKSAGGYYWERSTTIPSGSTLK